MSKPTTLLVWISSARHLSYKLICPFKERVVSIVGCPDPGRGALSCLRSASVGEYSYLLGFICCYWYLSTGAISSAINRAGPFSPVVDGPNGFFPALPGTLFASGNFSTVEFIGGHCTNDGRTFVGGDPSDFVTDADVIERVFARFSTLVRLSASRYLGYTQ